MKENIDAGVRKAVVSEMVVGLVINIDRKEIVFRDKILENFIPLIAFSWSGSSICITTYIYGANHYEATFER